MSSQITIIHLSDIHFGSEHRFEPRVTPDGDRPSKAGYPSLIETLQADWSSLGITGNKVIIAITGDITQRALADEFLQAKELLENLTQAPVLGSELSKEDIFVVPGNHDVVFDEPNVERRWQPFCSFYQNFYKDIKGRQVYSDSPTSLSRVHDRTKDLGLIVLELNSCVYVKKDSPDQERGQIDIESIQNIRKQLDQIPEADLNKAIRVALVHHHPVLIPAFAEPGRKYDAILNSNWLLMILRDYGFHVVLHGHKHHPHAFSYDVTSTWSTNETSPIMIVAGGSAGSESLPTVNNAINTYNIVTIRWNHRAKEARVHIETRGLSTYDRPDHPILPGDRKWTSLRVIDRILIPRQSDIESKVHYEPLSFEEKNLFESHRIKVYEKLRGNMPVVEVVPSLYSRQEYEARVWIVPHKRQDSEIPTEVIWSAGPLFDKAVCNYSDNPDFRATFAFYKPMVIQARMQFADGTYTLGYVYAQMPGS